MRRSVRAVLVVAVSLSTFLSTQQASACSRSFTTFKVRQDFAVVVNGRDGKPIEGIAVKIVLAAPTLDKVAEDLTDKEGKASFHGLMVSDYWISAEHAGVSGTVGKLWPVNDSSGQTEITLTWPIGPIVGMQTVAGALLLGNGSPLASSDVWLTDTLSGKELGRTSTDAKGRFAFQGVDAGLYVLHVEERRDCARYLCKVKGNILVEVDANAKNVEFPRYRLAMTSCGLAAHEDDGSNVLFE